jgi:two-component system, OmpR family, copper resistance phosphate regulon response regulator CusR
MKILLVEDDRRTLGYLGKGLVESGFAVDAANGGDDGLYLTRSGDDEQTAL